MEELTVAGERSSQEADIHINSTEMRAVLISDPHALQDKILDTSLLLKTNNFSVMASVNKQEGAVFLSVGHLTQLILSSAELSSRKLF